jgi:hypothetical protein
MHHEYIPHASLDAQNKYLDMRKNSERERATGYALQGKGYLDVFASSKSRAVEVACCSFGCAVVNSANTRVNDGDAHLCAPPGHGALVSPN